MAIVRWGAEGTTTGGPWVLPSPQYIPYRKRLGEARVEICICTLEGDVSPDS